MAIRDYFAEMYVAGILADNGWNIYVSFVLFRVASWMIFPATESISPGYAELMLIHVNQ
jgi:hypothetical protein